MSRTREFSRYNDPERERGPEGLGNASDNCYGNYSRIDNGVEWGGVGGVKAGKKWHFCFRERSYVDLK